MCKKHNVDYQTIDFQSLWDNSLSYGENKKRIMEIIKNMSPSNLVEYNKSEEEHFEREMARMEEIKELDKYFSDYYAHIDAFLENKTVNGFLVIGKGGFGKTFNLIKHLQKRGINFVLLKGHITPLKLYKILYEFRENSFIIIDDIIAILKNQDAISFLLGALDYNSRMVCWNSQNPLTADLPRQFIFNSKIFILTNEFNETNEFLAALKDRCVAYELKFDKEEIIEMLYIIAKQKGYPTEIVDYIKELCESSMIKHLSLRLVDKLYPYYGKDNWKELVRQVIEVDELESFVYNLIKSGKSVKEQISEFAERTGLSRATYFRIKSKILKG